jgi:hypothetical protein
MSGLFARLAARAVGTGRVLRPRVRSRFEPPELPEPLPLEAASETSESEADAALARRPAVHPAADSPEVDERDRDVPEELRMEPRSPQRRIEHVVRGASPPDERPDAVAEQQPEVPAEHDATPATAAAPAAEAPSATLPAPSPAPARTPGTLWEEVVAEATELTARTRERIALRRRPQSEPPDDAAGKVARQAVRVGRAGEPGSPPRAARRAEAARNEPAAAPLPDEAATEERAGADGLSESIPPALLARPTTARSDVQAPASARASDAEEDTIVRIHVGRVELRGNGSTQPAPVRPERATPRVSLESYLQSVQRHT